MSKNLEVPIVMPSMTASEWSSKNPKLLEGEWGWESDTNKVKIGDGVKLWNALDYLVDVQGGTTIKGVWQPTVTSTPALAKMQREGVVFMGLHDTLIDEVVFTDNSVSTSANGEGGMAISSTPFDISNSSEDRFVIYTKYEGSETPYVVYYAFFAGLGRILEINGQSDPIAFGLPIYYWITETGLVTAGEYEDTVIYDDWNVYNDSAAQVMDFDKGVVEFWTSRNGGTKEVEWSFAEIEQSIYDNFGTTITIDKQSVTHAVLNTYFPFEDGEGFRLVKSGKMSAAKTFDVFPSAVDVFGNTQVVDLTPPENAANNAFTLSVDNPVYIPELDKELESGDVVFFDSDSKPFRYLPQETGLNPDSIETDFIQDEAVTKAKLGIDVQSSLDKADSALQSHQSLEGYATEVYVGNVANTKVDKVAGKQLSDENYTATEKNKLADVADNATKNTGSLADKNSVGTGEIDDEAVTKTKLAQDVQEILNDNTTLFWMGI